MTYLKQGAAGLATLTAVAIVATLTPGAQAASPAPTVQAPTSRVAAQTPERTPELKSAAGSLTTRVQGTFGRDGTVRGTFEPRRFVVRHGETFAFGSLHATLRKSNGDVVGKANRLVALPIKNGRVSKDERAAARCDILNLVLGPLDLNLLGLRVQLNRVVLDVFAQTGAGRLLGNLLCAVAGLLDGTSLLDRFRLANLLNRILGVLRI